MTPREIESADLCELRPFAEINGVIPALEALSALVPLPSGAGRYLLLPETVIPPTNAKEARRLDTDGGSLIVWRTSQEHLDDRASSLWWLGVSWLRLGLSERLLTLASNRLRDRRVGDQATINLAPVRLVIADAVLAHAEAAGALCGGRGFPPPIALTLAGHAIDRSLRLALGLFGAAGYVDDGPGRLARCAELLGNVEGRHHAQ